MSRKKPIPDQNRSGGRLHSPSFHCVFIILIREKTGHSIKSSYLCKILLPVKGTSPSGNGTALRPLLFTQIPGLHLFSGGSDRKGAEKEIPSAVGTKSPLPARQIHGMTVFLHPPIRGPFPGKERTEKICGSVPSANLPPKKWACPFGKTGRFKRGRIA